MSNKSQSNKSQLRDVTRTSRSARGSSSLIDDPLITHLLSHLQSLGAKTIAAYSPLPAEPGGPALLPALAEADYDIWLPVTLAAGQLQWARFEPGRLTPGKYFGISEPAGQRHDSTVLAACDAIIVPALAVDKHGMRLGQGAGYYDRALVHAPGIPRIALVYDDEVYAEIPADPHDQPVDAAVTQTGVKILAH